MSKIKIGCKNRKKDNNFSWVKLLTVKMTINSM